MSEVRRMGFDNLRDAWRITDLNSNFEYVPLHYNCVTNIRYEGKTDLM